MQDFRTCKSSKSESKSSPCLAHQWLLNFQKKKPFPFYATYGRVPACDKNAVVLTAKAGRMGNQEAGASGQCLMRSGHVTAFVGFVTNRLVKRRMA